jgi:hypothetical protein
MEHNGKNPGTAAVLSFVFSGLGQLYNGQILKGLAIIFFTSLSLIIFIVGAVFVGFWIIGRPVFSGQLFWGMVICLVSLLFMCTLGIYSIVDAHATSGRCS